MTKLSVIIPSWKDPLLINTINALLQSFESEGGFEIIGILDGFWTSEFVTHPAVRYVHLGKNRGMREAISAGVAVSRGQFLMKCDSHCSFAPSFDTAMLENYQPNTIMTALRHALDPDKWEVMPGDPIGYEKLVIHEGVKFAGVRWRNRDIARKDVLVDETMMMQGSFWMMSREWWDKIGGLSASEYGPFGQEMIELGFKTWSNGGKLMLNKKTWYAHKHRTFGRTWGFGPKKAEPGRKYALSKWQEYFLCEVKPKWR